MIPLHDQRTPARVYAHFHRLLIALLEDLAEQERVVWLGEVGHLRGEEGQPNTYRRALYGVEDLEPYQERLREVSVVRREGLALAGPKAPGLLVPVVIEGVVHAVLRRSENYASHALDKKTAVAKLAARLGKTRNNLAAFGRYARPFDPRREKVEGEVAALEVALERLKAFPDTHFRERARTERVSARLLVTGPDGEEHSRSVYVREVGLVAVGPGMSRPESVEFAVRSKRRSDRMRLEPLLRYGNFEVYSEREWQEEKAAGGVHP